MGNIFTKALAEHTNTKMQVSHNTKWSISETGKTAIDSELVSGINLDVLCYLNDYPATTTDMLADTMSKDFKTMVYLLTLLNKDGYISQSSMELG